MHPMIRAHLRERPRRAGGTRLLVVVLLALFVTLGCASAPAGSAEPTPRAEEGAAAEAGGPLLWRVESDPPLYLFGTIHLPDERVLALHPAVEAAFSEADEVIVELPLDLETQASVASAAFLPEDESLADHLDEELYERVVAFFTERGFPAMALERIRPWALAAQVPMMDYLPKMATTPVLDQLLWNRAGEEGKRRSGLESVDEQLAAFEALTPKQHQTMLELALDQVEEAAAAGGPGPTEELIGVYLRGRESEIAALLEESYPDPELQAAFAEHFNVRRNELMAKRLAARLAEPGAKRGVLFVGVGALHLVDDVGVPALLEERGFELVRVGAEQEQPAAAGEGR